MKNSAAILFFLSSVIIAHAQSPAPGVIKGKAVDDKQVPVPFATVLLKSAGDSALYKGELADEDGNFILEQVKPGNYFLELRAINYTPVVRNDLRLEENGPGIDLANMILPPLAQAIGEVEVKADKPFIERQVDRTVVNVENSIIHVNSSVIEVLEKLPGVMVSQEGIISLKGKQGVIVTIDNKPTGLSGQDLANMLRGLSSSNIQKIEIITNPPARYDAAGSAGIINIVMKKNRKEGFSGSVSAGYGQGRYEKYNSGVNLAFRRNKSNYYLSYSFSHRKGFNNLVLTRNFFNGDTLNTVFETDDYILFPFNTHTPRMGADFDLSSRTSLSLLATGVVNHFNPTANNHTDILNGQDELVSSYDFINHSQDKWYNYAGNTQIRHRFDTTGQELTADLDYARYWNNTDQQFTTTQYDSAGNYAGQSTLVGDQDGALVIYSAKTDYTKPLKNNARFDAGLKSSYVEADNNVLFYNKQNELLVLDSTISNHFLYSENINAAYINYRKEFKKLTMQLGLRGEQTVAKGEQQITGQKFRRDYLQPFPSVFFDYKLSEKHGLNLSLSRRIDRPAYQQMNPFRRLIDATTYAEGNPYLLPQLTYNAELTYTFKESFFATLGYSFTTDNITEALIQDNISRLTVQTTVNLARFHYYSLNLNYSKKLTEWWTTNTSLLSYYGIYTGTINQFTINQGIPSFYLNTNNSFPLTKTISMELGFMYSHRMLYGVTTLLPNYNLTAGVQFSLFKKRGSLTINGNDLLWKAYPSGVTHFGNVDEYWTAIRDTRQVNINFSYRFGKGQAGRMRRNTGADEEKGRTSVSG
ncbi:MAG: TonB-dependent receptor plug [Bacteroidetes bacterium]|nr:MAG: TonB-dependent receptor plug [Bacteroidota bacterium]